MPKLLVLTASAALILLAAPRPASNESPIPDYVSPLAGKARLLLDDVIVASDAKAARIPVRLEAPLRRPVRFRYATRNGTAVEGTDYRPSRGDLMFAPGETRKLVEVQLMRPLGERSFDLIVGWPQFHPPFGNGHLSVRAGAQPTVVAAPKPVTYPQAPRTEGRQLVFETRFLEPVRDKNREGEWRSGFAWGRVQEGNGEVAPYTDARLHGTDPHPIVDGRRALQAERRKLKLAGKDYDFSTAMLSSRGMRAGWRYGYFELRVRVPRAQGTTAAFWMLPDDDYAWPPETDIFEIFQKREFGASPPLTSTIHFEEPDGRKRQEGIHLPFDRPFDWHVIGFDWSPQWMVTFIDGKEAVRRPNIFHQPMTVLLTLAVGGLTERPGADVAFPARMELDYLKVWQSDAERRASLKQPKDQRDDAAPRK